MDRPSFLSGKPGRIAIAVAFQTSCVVALMLGVGQCFGFRDSQLRVVTSFLPVLARREVALVFCIGCLSCFQRSEFGVVALVPAVFTILRVALVLSGGQRPWFAKELAGSDCSAQSRSYSRMH